MREMCAKRSIWGFWFEKLSQFSSLGWTQWCIMDALTDVLCFLLFSLQVYEGLKPSDKYEKTLDYRCAFSGFHLRLMNIISCVNITITQGHAYLNVPPLLLVHQMACTVWSVVGMQVHCRGNHWPGRWISGQPGRHVGGALPQLGWVSHAPAVLQPYVQPGNHLPTLATHCTLLIGCSLLFSWPLLVSQGALEARDYYVPNPSCKEFHKYEWIGQLMGAALRGKDFLVSDALSGCRRSIKSLSGEN